MLQDPTYNGVDEGKGGLTNEEVQVGKEFIKRLSIFEMGYEAGRTPGLASKTLRRDPDTGAAVRVIGTVPHWRKVGWAAVYHECVEEVFVVSGDLVEDDATVYSEGCYFYRPPAIVHGNTECSLDHGFLILNFSDAKMESFTPESFPGGSYPGEYPIRDITDPRGHVQFLDSNGLAWVELGNGLAEKVLSSNPVTGAKTAILRFPPAWRYEAHRHDYDEEIFVLHGEFTADGEKLSRGCYSYRPSETVHGEGLSSDQGAVLLLKQGGAFKTV